MSKVSEAWYFGNREYLSEEVEKNALDFEKLIDPRLWEEDDEADTNVTGWGTVTLDFYVPDNGLVSVEVGKIKVGYFTEFEDGINYESDGFDWPDHTKVDDEMLEWFLKGKNKKKEEEKEFLKQRAIFCGLPNVWIMYKNQPFLVFGYGAGRLALLPSAFSSVTYREEPLLKEVQVILRKEEDITEDEKKGYEEAARKGELEEWMNLHCVDHRDLIPRGWAVDAASLGDKNPYRYGICFGESI
jgi:hypothetical protein